MPPRPADFLLTNDDGIHAPGLAALRAAFEGRVRTTVAAPASNSSAVGHSITIHRPISCDPVPLGRGRRGFSVDGTPADCVKLALCELFPRPPRFVLSGINFGANLGVNVFYSGTVAAALEASFAGIPSFAMSLCTKSAPRWKDAGVIARRVVDEFAPFVEGTPVCLNVNIPNLPVSRIRGVRFTHQAPVAWEDAFHRRLDPRGRTYFWMDGDQVASRNGRAARHNPTDIEAVRMGYVSITPLRLSMTCEATFERLAPKGKR
ncbi:MAG: 5'/3'-nucleotidase SurE [Planctomycetota bacterium]